MLLAIDCGSTNFKAALFDQACGLGRVADASLPVPYLVYDHERVEMDPEAIWRLFVSLVRQTCNAGKIAPRDVRMIAFTSQAQTFTVVDAADRALLPLIGWADKRAVKEADELTRRFDPVHPHNSFWAIFPQSTASKLLWACRQNRTLLTAGNRVVFLPSFLSLRLAGVNAADPNLAAMGGLYSMIERGWWRGMLDAVGVTPAQLPEVVAMGQPVPARRLTPDLELSPDLRVVMACNDQTSGAMGNRVQRGGAIVTLGTALVAYRHAGDQPGPYNPRSCWGPFPTGGYYELATRDEGCATLDWADRQLHGSVDSPRFMTLAASTHPRDDACFFFPQRWNTPAAWSDPGAGPAEKARAVLEGISFCARQLVRDDLRIDPSRTDLTVIGGGSRFDGWLQMLADVLNAPVRRGEGDTLLGAARIAAGVTASTATSTGANFAPSPQSVNFYATRYAKWAKLAR